jgi:hypothetical protein
MRREGGGGRLRPGVGGVGRVRLLRRLRDFDALLAREDAAQHRRAPGVNPVERALAHAVGREHRAFGDPLLERRQVGLEDAFGRRDLPDFRLGFHT